MSIAELRDRAEDAEAEATSLLAQWERSNVGRPEDLAAAQVYATLALAARQAEANQIQRVEVVP